jgi:hypothetical protein
MGDSESVPKIAGFSQIVLSPAFAGCDSLSDRDLGLTPQALCLPPASQAETDFSCKPE